MPGENKITFETFLGFKDRLAWRRVAKWVPGVGAVKHLVWKGFLVEGGKVVDIPMFFAYVNVDGETGKTSMSLSANVRFDPSGKGQRVIDTTALGDASGLSDRVVAAAMQERYGVNEVDFAATPVGGMSAPKTALQVVMHKRLVDRARKLLANVYLNKVVSGGSASYRVDTLVVDMERGLLSGEGARRQKPEEPTIRGAVDDFERTVRQLRTIGFADGDDVPEWANGRNWDFDMSLPIDIAGRMKNFLASPPAGASDELDAALAQATDEADGVQFGPTRYAQDISRWYQGQVPDPAQLERYVGGPSVDASQIKSAFGGVDEAISMVNSFDASLLSNVAFIFNYVSGGEYGIYVSALDEKIRREAVKARLRSAGFQVQDAPDGSFTASSQKLEQGQADQQLQSIYREIESKGATTFGVNMNKVLSASQADALESGISDQQDAYDLTVLHLGATMVHEAVHSRGSQSEGPSEEMENRFMQWGLQKLNDKRLQRMRAEHREQEFAPLQVVPGKRRSATLPSWFKTAQYGAQFPSTAPRGGPAPWSGVLWDRGVDAIENMLGARRTEHSFQDHHSAERQMREFQRAKWDNEVDAGELTETLLGRDRMPLEAYKTTETLMRERRKKPLAVPVSARRTAGIEVRASDDGMQFGWMNNLDLPMSERVWSGSKHEDDTWMNWQNIRGGIRYNPEYGYEYSKAKDIYAWWRDARLEPELWDDMIANRPCFSTSPASRFASAGASPGGIPLIFVVLEAAFVAIWRGAMRGTRFVCSDEITEYVRKFFAADDLAIHVYRLGDRACAVWVVLPEVGKDAVAAAEAYISGKDGSEQSADAFESITCFSRIRRGTVLAIIEAVRRMCRSSGFRGMCVAGPFPRALLLKSSWADVNELDFVCDRPRDCLLVAGRVFDELGTRDIGYDSAARSRTLEWGGVRCVFRGSTGVPARVAEMAEAAGVASSPLMVDALARDFTVNMVVYGVDDRRLYDLTRRGAEDAKAKVLRTFVDPKVVIDKNPAAALRAVKLAVKHGLSVDPALEAAIREGNSSLERRYGAEQVTSWVREVLCEGTGKATDLLEYYGMGRFVAK